MKTNSSIFSKFHRKNNFSVYDPSEISISFDQLIGLETAKEDLKDVIEYIKSPEMFDKLGIRPHMHYLIQGPDGVGKSSLAFALAKETNIPIVVVDCKNFVNTRKKAFTLLHDSFKTAASYNRSVLLLRGFDRFLQIDDSFKVTFLAELVELMKKYKDIIIISTLSILITFINGDYLFDEDTFSKTIDIQYPDLKTREEMYKLFCSNLPIDQNVSFARLAIDSYSMAAKDIKMIIKNATLLALRNGSETITREHFDEMISLELLGQKRKKMTEKERRSTAYHEAGHVIAGYFSDPEYKLSKVEIVHRSESLGVTMQDNDEDKLSMFKKDWENEIICNFGGMVAERIIFNENSSGVVQDLATATSAAKLMVCTFGMCDEFGPISVYDLNPSSDGAVMRTVSESQLSEINTHVRNILVRLYNTCFDIVTNHRNELEALAQALLEKEIVYGNEIKEIFNKCQNNQEES